ncbi:cysteine-rich CWC family protein [Vibrio vulnificus]|nr:cysteine-rich CWC family protein [Vibrio vulnificus]ELK2280306.1 cysteine-rich CWC family protein [Vibrio vulnificus]
MKTPCVAACKNNDGICEGCLRTVTEIANWSRLNDLQREEIMAQLDGRTATHECPSCTKPTQCDIAQGKTHCWCFDLEEREVSVSSKGLCLCRRCLEKAPIA